jgi:hypothetical protein
MDNLFVPYEIALKLKELGFDEPCFGFYHICNTEELKDIYEKDFFFHEKSGNFNSNCPQIGVPLYQQAFKFFREKYKLYQYIKQYYGERFYFTIEDMVHPRRFEEYPIEKIRNFGEYYSQEEAELACLQKLIEIINV